MKKLLKKVLFNKKAKIPVQDPIQVLIARLCDPLDELYDENFVKGLSELANENKQSR